MRLIILLVTYSFLSACTSLANIDYDRSANFKSLKTYDIQIKPVRVSKDTRVNSPFMLQRVTHAIEESLTKKGFRNLKGKTDFKVKYYLDLRQDVEIEDTGLSIGMGTSSHHSAVGFAFNVPLADVYTVDRLVLTIDIFSTKTDKLIWRSSLGYHMDEGASPESYTQLVNELVEEILESYPPK